MRIALAFAMLLSTALSAPADEHHNHPLNASAVGEVVFPSTCAEQSASAVRTGVALLHSFWYDEAEKTFRHALELDPHCAIAWWGVAMTDYHPLWSPSITPAALHSGAEAIAAARKLRGGSERENAYIDALTVFYDQPPGTTVHERAVRYEAAMAGVVAGFPADDEAAIFYALALNGSALPSDKTYAKQKQAAAILNRLLPTHPRHPGIAHYLIHSYDSPPLAPLALDAARSYARIAPAVPHALHMPSHIFTRLGLWDESVAANLRSAEAAENAHLIDEKLHAMDYLEYAYLQLGRVDEARRLVDEVRSSAFPEGRGKMETKASFAIAAIPARFALERHDWRSAAQLVGRGDVDWNSSPRTAALIQFANGVGAARSGDIQRAQTAETTLARFVDAVRRENDPTWTSQLEVQQKTVAAWRLFASGDKPRAVSLMREAADEEDLSEKLPVTPGALLPARELLADMLLEMEKPEAAAKEYKAVLEVAPNRRNALAGQSRAAAAVAAMGQPLRR